MKKNGALALHIMKLEKHALKMLTSLGIAKLPFTQKHLGPM